MQIDKLSGFNKRFFSKIFGLQIRQKRQEFGYSCEYVSEQLGLTTKVLKLIESGQKTVSQEQFELFRDHFKLNSNDLLELSRITHVQYMMALYKEIDANFPA